MSKGAQITLKGIKSFSHPSSFVLSMSNQYKAWVLDEETAPLLKGSWREKIFKAPWSTPLDLEIGPGAGDFLHYISRLHKNRFYLSIELKYKPLVQSARKLKKSACKNARLVRYNGRLLQNIFAPQELNNVHIYFPDPWPKKRHHKHRLIKPDFVHNLYKIQRPNSFVQIKTDHHAYFKEIKEIFKESPYIEKIILNNLHRQVDRQVGKDNNNATNDSTHRHSMPHPQGENFITFFESIFIKQNHPICYAKYIKPPGRQKCSV